MSILAPNSHILYRATTQHRDQYLQLKISGSCLVFVKSYGIRFDDGKGGWKKIVKIRELKAKGFWPDMSRPSMVEMEYVTNSEHLDQILAKASELDQAIIIDWMAAWCRKCIYLKPKLEKLAAEYDTKVKFYCVDVNNVPQALVKRGGISKMPTIQLWKDGEVKAEVIGGHKAWIVIEEVREMIQKFL